jgi:hypothetical protein
MPSSDATRAQTSSGAAARSLDVITSADAHTGASVLARAVYDRALSRTRRFSRVVPVAIAALAIARATLSRRITLRRA